MPQPTADLLRAALEGVAYPGFTRNIVSFGLVQDVAVEGGVARVTIAHTIDDGGVLERIRRDAKAALEAVEGVSSAELQFVRKGQAAAAPADPERPLPGVKHVVAVASAKGGVGKSTVAVNLALALAARGHRTGLMDADIYGPSVPTMMGVVGQPEITADKRIIPIDKDGVRLMSMGFLVPPERAMIWRGPMVMGAVQQFLSDVEWGELDVLVVDMPPGTGDAQLTLVQKVPLSGAVMVTTPQLVALADVVRGIQMFESTNAPIVGVVENMSGFVCPSCDEHHDIFGSGGGRRTSERYGVPFLGAVPIDLAVREGGDEGRPVVVGAPESPGAKAFLDIADQVDRFLQDREEGAARA